MSLSDGVCHYPVDGPSYGPAVLLIHGATVPAWELDRLVPFLTGAGYRTSRADLLGHGYSDRPRLKYELALFVRQLSQRPHGLRINEPVTYSDTRREKVAPFMIDFFIKHSLRTDPK